MIIPKNVVDDAGYETFINMMWTIIWSYLIEPRIYDKGPDTKIETTMFETNAVVITY
jgi:hypothetical protein